MDDLISNINASDIDHFLDEIDKIDNQQPQKHGNIQPSLHGNNDNDINWDQILHEIGNINVPYIKNIITSKQITTNSHHPETGKTLLIYAVIIGNEELVKVICNFGADVHVKDNENMDAVDYAKIYGRYKITELLYFRQLSGSLGNDLKDIAKQIHQKNKQAKMIQKYESGHGSLSWKLIRFMENVIRDRAIFPHDMLYYAWYFVNYYDNGKNGGTRDKKF